MSANLTTEICRYPLPPAVQEELLRLLRTEWTRTDYDWAQAMSGAYSAALVFQTVLLRDHGQAVATATIHYSRHHPEVAVLGNVLTHRDHRGGGLAGRVIEAALAEATQAGCAVCLLGSATKPRNVYLQHGFEWQSGVVMRRGLAGAGFEPGYFAPGQDAQVRAANWGDLPGLTLLVTQPVATRCLDFPRRLLSAKYFPLGRCLSNFPALWAETAGRDGLCAVLAGPQSGRVWGFGSATRDSAAGRPHVAILDAAVHDHYSAQLPAVVDHLLVGCRSQGIHQAEAFIVAGDEEKLRGFLSRGFREVGQRSLELRPGIDPVEVILLGLAGTN